MAFKFQFVNRLSALPSVDTPGFVWLAWKYSSGGANTSFFWLKKSMPPAPTSFRLWLAVATAWYVAVTPPVKRDAVSSFLPSAMFCSGFDCK